MTKNIKNSLTISSLVLIILIGGVYVEAAKAPRRSGQKGKPNHDAIALSYGSSRKTGTIQQHQTKQVHQQTASAPPLPNNSNNNRPIGWNIPASNTPIQQKTVPITNTGLQAPSHNPGYPTQNVAPQQYPQHPPLNPVGGGYNPQQQSVGGGYNPQQGGYHGGYNPQQGGYHPQPAYPNPSHQQPIGYNGQQAPVVNNYYPPQTGTGGSGSSIAKNALLLGAGGLAGAAIYGALKPGEETKTVIIHDTVPNAAAVPTTAVQTSETNVPLASVPSNVPLAPSTNVPIAPTSNNVPLAQWPETTSISGTTMSNQPNVPDSNMNQTKLTEQRSNNNNTTINAESPISLQEHLKGHAAYLKALNIFVYTAMTMILAKLSI